MTTSPELELVSTAEKAASRFFRTDHLPDDGEPDPAGRGYIPPGAAPCGRPEPCDKGDCASCRASGGRGHPEYLKLADELKRLHLLKSGGYGTGKDPFANYTAVAVARNQPRFVYVVDRAQEKLTRVYSLIAQERFDELEEEFLDIASSFLCAAAMHREDTPQIPPKGDLTS